MYTKIYNLLFYTIASIIATYNKLQFDKKVGDFNILFVYSNGADSFEFTISVSLHKVHFTFSHRKLDIIINLMKRIQTLRNA